MEIVSYKINAKNSALERIRARALQMNPELVARVTEIVDGVRAGGDEALIHYTHQFDGVDLTPATLRVEEDFIQRAAAKADARTVAAFRQAIGNVKSFHEHQKERGWQIRTAEG